MVQRAREYSMATQVTTSLLFLSHNRHYKFFGAIDNVFLVDGVEVIPDSGPGVERQGLRDE